MATQAFADAITGAYRQYLGRDPEAGQIDWRFGQLNKRDLGGQIADIQNSSEAQAYKGRQSTPAPAAPAGPSAEQQQVTGLTNELTNFDKNRASAVDIYNRSLEALGIADARTRVSGLREALLNTESLYNNVEGDISGRTSEALVSEGQRRRLVAKEQEPLAARMASMGRNLEVASADYQGILGEGKTQADLQFQQDSVKRNAIMDRLKLAIDNSKSAEDKRRWTEEFNRLKAQDAEATRQFNANLALEQQKMSLSKASGGGRSGGGGSGGGVSQGQAVNEFLSFISNKFKASGGAGSYKASRQEQDNWANAWFAEKGIKDPNARQMYWDAFNSKYNRPENPYDDWLFKK